MSTETLDRERVRADVEARRGEYVKTLREWVEIPSVSAERERKADCRRCAERAADSVRHLGGTARLVETSGNPVVVAELPGPAGSPVVTLYNHLDVQPATEGQDGWTRPPFRFHEDGDRFYGRGATDDKGPAVTALFGAALARERGVPITVRFVWELEEEIGSPSFESFLLTERERLATDVVVVSDTVWLSAGKPAIPYGLRGLCTAHLVLETATKDAHSGVTGGAARNPIVELCAVIASCINARTGAITIDGFDRTWSPATPEEVEGFLAAGFDTATFRAAHGFHSLRTDDPREITQCVWTRPTFEVHGITGGYQGEGVKTVVPPRAAAKVSFRLVPPQRPEEILDLLRAHVRARNADVEVRGGHGIEAWLGPRTGPIADAAADAFEFGFGKRPVLIREGGSIGAVLLMDRILGAPIVLMGLSLPEQGYHGPDEFFDWGQASGGIAAFAHFLDRVALRGRG
jgi:acetylornithine deacetylase/succinyl-diaminopimelate desuccinylase-like protein